MKFNFDKYKQWRIDRGSLTEEIIEIIEQFNNYRSLNGIDRDTLLSQGKLILEEWCDHE